VKREGFMSKINYGVVHGRRYLKKIDFNRAVLWKTREISLAAKVVDHWFPEHGIEEIVFVDFKKEKIYTVSVRKAEKHWVKKTMHQDSQYYFSIGLLTTLPLRREEQIPMIDPDDFRERE